MKNRKTKRDVQSNAPRRGEVTGNEVISSDTSNVSLSFWDTLGDIYSPPEFIKLRKVNSGNAGLRQDAARINGYFTRAIRIHEKSDI